MLSQFTWLFCTDALMENAVVEYAETVKVCDAGAVPPTVAVNDNEALLIETRLPPS